MNIIPKTFQEYGEMGQINPIRWTILHRKGEDYIYQSNPFKCKDFFNDVVAYRKVKKSFEMYGFKNNVKFNREGLYVLLTNLRNLMLFDWNLAKLNSKLIDQGLPYVALLDDLQSDESCVLLFKKEHFASTYIISLLTILIRCCNYNIQFDCWDDFFSEVSPLNTVENSFTQYAKELSQKYGFIPPVKEWVYLPGIGADYDLEDHRFPNMVHNNGVSNWALALKINKGI